MWFDDKVTHTENLVCMQLYFDKNYIIVPLLYKQIHDKAEFRELLSAALPLILGLSSAIAKDCSKVSATNIRYCRFEGYFMFQSD